MIVAYAKDSWVEIVIHSNGLQVMRDPEEVLDAHLRLSLGLGLPPIFVKSDLFLGPQLPVYTVRTSVAGSVFEIGDLCSIR